MNTVVSINNVPVRFIRKREMLHLTGLSSSSAYHLMSIGLLPKSIKISEKSVAWLLSDILEWQAKRLAENGVSATEAANDQEELIDPKTEPKKAIAARKQRIPKTDHRRPAQKHATANDSTKESSHD
ncbi:MAG: AlpA family transcriptional regulator [Agitococcus sp.]|nr:AlpA family transcriptional regulator [Agitococcus sp.]